VVNAHAILRAHDLMLCILEEGKPLKMLNKRDFARDIPFVKLSKDLIVLSNHVIVRLVDHG
jgi:hypothetical protein